MTLYEAEVNYLKDTVVFSINKNKGPVSPPG